jgi:hypothetical protein
MSLELFWGRGWEWYTPAGRCICTKALSMDNHGMVAEEGSIQATRVLSLRFGRMSKSPLRGAR